MISAAYCWQMSVGLYHYQNSIFLVCSGPKKDKDYDDKVASLRNMGFEEVSTCYQTDHFW